MADTPTRVADLASREPGEDPENPYADVDVAGLPDWWQHAIREFEAHGMRPYRPPRFADGTLKYELVERLEAELDASIRFLCRNPAESDVWTVRVDGTPVGRLRRRRDPEGYSVYEMAAEEFAAWLRERVDAADGE